MLSRATVYEQVEIVDPLPAGGVDQQGGQEGRPGHPELVEHRGGHGVIGDVAVVEGDRDRPRRQGEPVPDRGDQFGQADDVERAAQDLEQSAEAIDVEDVGLDLGVWPVVDDVVEAEDGGPAGDVGEAVVGPGPSHHPAIAIAQHLPGVGGQRGGAALGTPGDGGEDSASEAAASARGLLSRGSW